MNAYISEDSLPGIYQPLIDPRAIRLITLAPGTTQNPIRIDLNAVSIDSCGSYDALSYAWDDQKPFISISCGTRSILVTQNVYDALLELRSSESICRLWIDQVCINQKDLAERSGQVSLMGQIYLRAHRTVVWLGKADGETALAFDAIRKLTVMHDCSEPTQELWFVGSATDLKAVVDVYCTNSTETVRTAVMDLPLTDSPELRSLLGLLHRTWFQRMWVFQEVVLASNLSEFRCGSYYSKIQDFQHAMRTFDRCDYYNNLPFDERKIPEDAIVITRIGDDLHRSRDSQGLSGFNLEMLLTNTRRLRCHDPHDKVYAILGICDQKYLPHITPDYSLPLSASYCAVVRASLAADRSLTMLGHVQWFDARPSDLPSWVPDWRETRSAFGVCLGLRSVARNRYFNACNYHPLKSLPISDPNHLAVRGAKFHRITRRLPDRITRQKDDIPLDAKRYQYSEWCDMYRAEAERLKIPEFCVRTRGYGVSLPDDILCHSNMSESAKSKTLLAVALRRTLTADLYPRPASSRLEKYNWEQFFPHCARWARQTSTAEPTPEVLREHDQYVDQVVRSRLLFIAGEEPDNAYLCLASCDASVGDWICIMVGGDVPLVLRRRPRGPDEPGTGGTQLWEFICECYVDGIMDGEVFQEYWEPKMETFILN